MENKELIWVSKEIAEKHKAMESEENSIHNQDKLINNYMDDVVADSKAEFKANLESLDEDVAIYTGLMLKTKQAFKKAKDEALESSYALWEEYEKERPRVDEKVGAIVKSLDPLVSKLNEVNELFSKIKTYDIERFSESIKFVSGLYGENKEIVEFLVNNFKKDD